MDAFESVVGFSGPVPARQEVLECLVAGMGFLHSDTPPAAQRLAIRVLANIIIEHLDISGFEITRKPGM